MGVASIQTVDAVIPSNGGQSVEIVKVVIQLIIGLITIFKLIKKPKINPENSEKK
jgi:hypothetical protein